MTRRFLDVAASLLVSTVMVAACKGGDTPGAVDGGGGGTPKKLTCRMEKQCWVCPDEAAIKKCIINPMTSGCTQTSESDCR